MARLNAVGHNRNISISLPQVVIDKLEYQLRGKSMKRSVWVCDAIELKLLEVKSSAMADRSIHQIMLHLIHREDFSELESLRLMDCYEKMFGPVPPSARNAPAETPSLRTLPGSSASV